MASPAAVRPHQASFEELGTALYETPFVVIDIETTGGSPDADRITEIGALKTIGGVVEGTIETLIRPVESIPPFIELLTGINDFMVATAPPIEEVLPTLWEFMQGTILVAHNARFDSGFLSAAFARHGYSVPFRKSVCTLRMARWLLKGETRDLRLETLAGTLGTATRPCHRAFPDARATFELFHRLLEFAGPLGVLTCEDLIAFNRVGRRPDTAKARLAANIPRVCGVYKFVDARGRIIYIGKAKDLRSRVRSYFYGDERPKTRDLVKEVARIDIERHPTEISAEIRELRLIREHEPRYNRRSRSRGRSEVWIKISRAAVPRFVMARKSDEKTEPLMGPFASQGAAKEVIECISAAAPIARCTDPLKHPNGCAFGEMGQCMAPCLPQRREAYAALITTVEDDLRAAGAGLIERLRNRMTEYADDQRYEEAAVARDRGERLFTRIERQEFVRALREAGDLIVCIPRPEGTEATAIRNGRLVSSDVVDSPRDIDPVRLFAFAENLDSHPWITLKDEEEALILWRYLKLAASAGGWIEWSSGALACRVLPVPPLIKEIRASSR